MIIHYFVFSINALALPTQNMVTNVAVSPISGENLYSGIGLWVIIALVFSILLNRYLHHMENKPENDTKVTIPAPKAEVLKSNEINPEVSHFIAESA